MTTTMPEVATALAEHIDEIEEALGHASAREFGSVFLVALEERRGFLACSLESIVATALLVARLGWHVGEHGVAYLRVVNGELLPIPNYRGLVHTLRRHPDIGAVEVDTVHERDRFVDRRGLKPRFVHEPFAGAGGRGPLVAAYAIVVLCNGARERKVLYRDDIDDVRPHNPSPDSPWCWSLRTEGEMWCTVAAKKLAKWAPATAELSVAIALERAAERGPGGSPRAVEVLLRGFGIHVQGRKADIIPIRGAVDTKPKGARATCCNCEAQSTKPEKVSGSVRLTKPCPTTCQAYCGGDHQLCTPCARALLLAARSKPRDFHLSAPRALASASRSEAPEPVVGTVPAVDTESATEPKAATAGTGQAGAEEHSPNTTATPSAPAGFNTRQSEEEPARASATEAPDVPAVVPNPGKDPSCVRRHVGNTYPKREPSGETPESRDEGVADPSEGVTAEVEQGSIGLPAAPARELVGSPGEDAPSSSEPVAAPAGAPVVSETGPAGTPGEETPDAGVAPPGPDASRRRSFVRLEPGGKRAKKDPRRPADTPARDGPPLVQSEEAHPW